jgi:hypothetical protein
MQSALWVVGLEIDSCKVSLWLEVKGVKRLELIEFTVYLLIFFLVSCSKFIQIGFILYILKIR